MGFFIWEVIRFVRQEGSQQQGEWKEQVITTKRWPGKQGPALDCTGQSTDSSQLELLPENNHFQTILGRGHLNGRLRRVATVHPRRPWILQVANVLYHVCLEVATWGPVFGVLCSIFSLSWAHEIYDRLPQGSCPSLVCSHWVKK